jgi:peptidoglycan-associated lipoprotein
MRISPKALLTGACVVALTGVLGACATKRGGETPMHDHGGSPPAGSEAPHAGGPPSSGSTGGATQPYAGGFRPGSAEEFAAQEGDRVFFDYDQYTVRNDARAVLDAQAAWLQKWPQVTIRVEGNADERGTREYNFALAGRRASAVRQYLSERGVNPARMETISYGKERPLDTSGSEAGMARNRNAHTTIVSGAR